MRETVKEIKLGNRILRIFADESPESPRKWDNMGTMICAPHRKYSLGDKHDFDFKEYGSFEEAFKALEKKYDAAVILPLFMLDHSGITIRTTSFNDRWDSGQIGFILISKEKLRKEYSVKRLSKKILEKAVSMLEGEVETYDQYLRGDVYGFEVVKVDKCDKGCDHEEHEDSCWGFYGNNFKENGMTDNLDKEFAEALKAA